MPKAAKAVKPQAEKAKPVDVIPAAPKKKIYKAPKVVPFDKENLPETLAYKITAADCDFLLGCKEMQDKKNCHFTDEYGKHIYCTNNSSNRPLIEESVKSLMSQILEGYWETNGEAGILGESGTLLSFQHRLIAGKRAAQRWRIDLDESLKRAKETGGEIAYKWPHWGNKEPYITSVIVTGIKEDDRVVNTMDTGLPRTLWMVIYRCEEFKAMEEKERRACAKLLEHSIRQLWYRTGSGINSFSKLRSHAELVDFWHRHPSLVRCVKHVHDENKEGKIGQLLSPGYMAAMLYLMGTSGTVDETYRESDHGKEDMLDTTRMEDAFNWITLVAQCAEQFQPLHFAITTMLNSPYGISRDERIDLLVHCWNAYINQQPIDNDTLCLETQEYKTVEGKVAHMLCIQGSTIDPPNACRHLPDEHPTVGGIDLGHPMSADEASIAPTADEPTGDLEDPDSDIAKRAAAVRARKVQLVPSKAGKEWAVDDVAWVEEQDGDHYLATVKEVIATEDGGKTVTVTDGKGNDWDVHETQLTLTQPGKKETKAAKPAKVGINELKVGQLYWVLDKHGDPWQGRLTDLNPPKKQATLMVEPGHQGAGSERKAPIGLLSTSQPTPAAV
jgi:hypothetical protein